MANTIGKFDYTITKHIGETEMPFDPFVVVVLNLGTTTVGSSTSAPFCSPHLMSDAEIDCYIRGMKSDLDLVGRRMRAALSKAKAELEKTMEGTARSDVRLRGIHRVDWPEKHTFGWLAQIVRVAGQNSKFFSDSLHGGTEAAQLAALKWYAEHAESVPIRSRYERMTVVRRNNRTGTSGVYRWPADGSYDKSAYWAAQWVLQPNSAPKRRKFSIAKYGEDEARRRANDARQLGLIDAGVDPASA